MMLIMPFTKLRMDYFAVSQQYRVGEFFYMTTSRDRKWYFAYRVEGDTIYVEDACHAQNMHESKEVIRITETELRQVIAESVRTCIRRML